MKTSAITSQDLAASVLAVPPLALTADYAIDRENNARILEHLRAGGVRTFMYGGNANLYNISPTQFRELCDLLVSLARDGDWFVPSVGSDYGKAVDQLTMLRDYPFPTAMALPHRFPATPAGIATGLRRLADVYGKPIIAYVKDDGYVDAADLGKLVADGAVCAVKYGTVRADPKNDAYLESIIAHVDRSLVISGIGERPAIDHLTKFGLIGFTSGSVCIAPGPFDRAAACDQARRSRRGSAHPRTVHAVRGFARRALAAARAARRRAPGRHCRHRADVALSVEHHRQDSHRRA